LNIVVRDDRQVGGPVNESEVAEDLRPRAADAGKPGCS
jgi:hypothetical protein